jgi:hypothetical protein
MYLPIKVTFTYPFALSIHSATDCQYCFILGTVQPRNQGIFVTDPSYGGEIVVSERHNQGVEYLN